jgi:4-hydroxybenzoate polyprenyltransferase
MIALVSARASRWSERDGTTTATHGEPSNRRLQVVRGIITLTRWKEHVLFVTVTTLLGVQFAGETLDARLFLVLTANWLAVAFAFMINDVEDAPDDALNPAKQARNPIAAGTLSPLSGYTASFFTALAAASVYAFLNPTAFWLGIGCLVLGVFYSWRPVRLKRIPLIDILSHSLLLAGLQLLCAYCAFAPDSDVRRWLPPFVFVTAVSAYGQLFNEVRDLDFDRKARLTHTAAVLGPRIAQLLMVGALTAAGGAVIYAIAFALVPWWALLLAVILGVVLLGQLILRIRRREVLTGSSFHNPALMAGVLAIVVWMAVDHIGG